MRQYMVHDFKTESVVFRGTESQCLNYINEEHPDQELELYWADPGDRHYIKPSFEEWLSFYYYEGFDANGLTDEEYYELEDAYNKEVSK